MNTRNDQPKCGVMFRTVDSYIQKLLDAGLKVAVVDQSDEASRNVIKRNITRIITPGTILDSSFLKPGTNNFLCSVVAEGNAFGLSWLDISTGEFQSRHAQSLGRSTTPAGAIPRSSRPATRSSTPN